MMTKRRSTKATPLLLAAAVLGSGALIAMNQPEVEYIEDRRIPVVEVIQFGKSTELGKFDSRTGEIWQLNGDPLEASVQHQWCLKVKGVGTRPAGSLRLQHTWQPGLFMVDAATGETWLLEERRVGAWAWELVRDVR